MSEEERGMQPQSPVSEVGERQPSDFMESSIAQPETTEVTDTTQREASHTPSADPSNVVSPQMDTLDPTADTTTTTTTTTTNVAATTPETSPTLKKTQPTSSSPRVSIVVDKDHASSGKSSTTTPAPPPHPKRVSSGRLRMERELQRMRQADENERLWQKDRRRREVRKAVSAVHELKKKEGVTLTPDVESSRSAIHTMMKEEERMALEKDQKKLRKETKLLQQQIDQKYGLKEKKQGHDLLALAEKFYKGKVDDKYGLPEQVRRELTREEIEDLRMVFDMFDVKGRGYITANDVKRAAGMLGFKAKKDVFTGMIEEITGSRNGRVTFVHFLQFVIKGQGDGDDPLDAILQCFRMLDQGQKGYLTADDLRSAADTQKIPLSNRAIREMIQEADVTGDAQVTSDEFIHLMLQSSMFRSTR